MALWRCSNFMPLRQCLPLPGPLKGLGYYHCLIGCTCCGMHTPCKGKVHHKTVLRNRAPRTGQSHSTGRKSLLELLVPVRVGGSTRSSRYLFHFGLGLVLKIVRCVAHLLGSILSFPSSSRSLKLSFRSLPFLMSFLRVAAPLSGASRTPSTAPAARAESAMANVLLVDMMFVFC